MTRGKKRSPAADPWIGLGVVCIKTINIQRRDADFGPKKFIVEKGERGRVVSCNQSRGEITAYEIVTAGRSLWIGVDVIADHFKVSP